MSEWERERVRLCRENLSYLKALKACWKALLYVFIRSFQYVLKTRAHYCFLSCRLELIANYRLPCSLASALTPLINSRVNITHKRGRKMYRKIIFQYFTPTNLKVYTFTDFFRESILIHFIESIINQERERESERVAKIQFENSIFKLCTAQQRRRKWGKTDCGIEESSNSILSIYYFSLPLPSCSATFFLKGQVWKREQQQQRKNLNKIDLVWCLWVSVCAEVRIGKELGE